MNEMITHSNNFSKILKTANGLCINRDEYGNNTFWDFQLIKI